MPASAGSVIKTQVKTIDGLSIRYAESEPRDVSAILLSPWPESLYTFEQMWSRLALPATTPACSSTGGPEATSGSEPREARARRLAVDGSELVFILMPIVIPLFLAIGIAAPYIADSRARTSAGASIRKER
jgi:hypothetical protein